MSHSGTSSSASKRQRVGHGGDDASHKSLSTPLQSFPQGNNTSNHLSSVAKNLNSSNNFTSPATMMNSQPIRTPSSSCMPPVPAVMVGSSNTCKQDEVSNVTNDSVEDHKVKLVREAIEAYTKNYLFPEIKFFVGISEDPNLSWSTNPRSVCQRVIANSHYHCNNFEEAWPRLRRYVYNKLTDVRNDKGQAITKAFYGK